MGVQALDKLPYIDLSGQNRVRGGLVTAGNRTISGRPRVLVIASSTGGTAALEVILNGLPVSCIPTVIVQHIGPGFTALLAGRLDGLARMEVREAADGDILRPGLVLLAPSDLHTRLQENGGVLSVECFAGERINGVMPAADILFESAAVISGEGAIGVVLTGMGADGADGLLRMRRRGARTIAQDKDSSVVYGMPKKANELGAAEFVLPLDRIAQKIVSLI